MIKLCEDENTWEKYHKFRTGKKEEALWAEDDDEGSPDNYLNTKWKVRLESVSKELDMKGWQPHAMHYAQASGMELRNCEYYATVFSPFAILRAIELKYLYHHRCRCGSVEFDCEWKFKLTGFGDPDGNGDFIQRKYAKEWPKGFDFSSPPFYDGNEGMEILCRYVSKCIGSIRMLFLLKLSLTSNHVYGMELKKTVFRI